jgi:hypothetical protein
MAVDTATTIAGFDTAKPAGGDGKAEGDDNLRHIKTVLKTTFPNVAGVATPSHTEMNRLTGLASTPPAPVAGGLGGGGLRRSDKKALPHHTEGP